MTDRGWIGQTKDASTGLQYLNARYYDPVIGRFTAIDPLADMSSPGTLDRFGYALDSPVTLSDPTGLRVPVGNGSDPDSGGSYDERRQSMVSSATGQETKLRMPGQSYRYVEKRGFWVDYSAMPGDPGVTGYDMARHFFKNGNPWVSTRANFMEGMGAFVSCMVSIDVGCSRRRILMTWDDIRAAGRDEAAYQETLFQAPSDSQLLGAMALGATGIAVLLTFGGATPLAVGAAQGTAGLLAVGSEAADPGPCRGERVVAAALWETATFGMGYAIEGAGSPAIAAAGDAYSEGFSPGSYVSC